MRRLIKDKRGISPVVTTVILVAVGIALAVAIGLWMSGLVATFTRFEKLEVTSAYATGSGPWTVKVTVKNTGSADATITSVMVNGIPTTDIGGITLNPVLPASVSVGSNQTFTINIPANQQIGNGKATSGTTLNIVLHSAAGKDYPASVTLP